MAIFTTRFIPVGALAIAAVILLVFGRVLHIRFAYVVVGVLAILFVAVWTFRQSRLESQSQTAGHFGIFLKAGLIFWAGAAYGIARSVQEGWQWIDLLYLGIPTALGAYLVWLAVTVRQRGRRSASAG
jgi:hypothetical protein